MRKIAWALALLAVGMARAEEADVKAVLAKAVAAHGGADALKKFPALSVKAKGKLFLLGNVTDYQSETRIQAPDRLRTDVRGADFKSTRIVNGDKGWSSVNGDTKVMGKEELAEAQEAAHVAFVARLVPLTGEGYALSPLPAIKVGDRPAVGVRVERKGRRDVSLYFDKDTGLLVQLQTRVKDLAGGARELPCEILYEGYKKVGGVQVAHKVTIKQDGKRALEYEVTEAAPAEKFDDDVFAKP